MPASARRRYLFQTSVSWQTALYNFRGQVVSTTIARSSSSSFTTTYNYDNRYRLGSVTVNDPGTGTDVSYAYDLNDNPTSVVRDPTNPIVTVALTYDGLDRVFNEATTVGGTSYPVNYAYDPSGRLTRLTYPDSTAVEYTYDAVGRTSTIKQATTTYGTFSYHADDLLKDVTFGNQITQAYLYNGRGWPTSIKATYQTTTYLDLSYAYASGNVLTMGSSALTYDRMDRLKTAIGGFGSQFYDYDAVGNRKRIDGVFLRPDGAGSSTQWTKSGSGGANWDRVDEVTNDGESTYVYTSTVGNKDLYTLADNTVAGTISAVTVTAVARAVSSSCSPNCIVTIKLRIGGSATDASPVKNVGTAYETVSHTWTTKPGGGAWTDADLDSLQAGIELVSGGTATTVRVTQVFVSVNAGTSSVSYTYADAPSGMNTLTSLVKNGVTTSLTYVPNGNLITKTGGWDYLWNSENLMTLAKLNGPQVEAYTYDGLGRRLRVDGATGSGAWTVSIFSGMDVIFEKDQAGGITKYVYANGMRIAKITPSGGVHYFLADHLGSTRKIHDSARVEQYAVEYEPFGKPYLTSGPQPDKHKFTMEKHDDPTGLVYLRARQYDPEIGRFVGADPMLGSLGNPQSLNRYAYVVNNPLKYTDPSGQLFLSPWARKDCGTFLECEASFRASTDIAMLGIGFIPGGDTISDAYFLFWSTVDLLRAPSWERGGWMALDFGSLMVPGLSFGTWARTGKVGANVLLPFLMGMVRKGDNLPTGGADDLLRRIDAAVPSPHFRDNFFQPDHGKFLGYNNVDEYAEGAKDLLRAGVGGKATLYRSGDQLLSLNRRNLRISIIDLSSGELVTFFRASEGVGSVKDFLEAGRYFRYYVR